MTKKIASVRLALVALHSASLWSPAGKLVIQAHLRTLLRRLVVTHP